MATPADKVAGAHPTTPIDEAAAKRHWVDHAARTTAVLAVLAAISSGQYANQFSRTILAQAEASDQWEYYQAKSIKRHLVNAQAEDVAAVKRYDQEMAEAKAQAQNTERLKQLHQRQGNWFQGAFIILQAGVVLCTVAASAKRKELWALAIAMGAGGL